MFSRHVLEPGSPDLHGLCETLGRLSPVWFSFSSLVDCLLNVALEKQNPDQPRFVGGNFAEVLNHAGPFPFQRSRMKNQENTNGRTLCPPILLDISNYGGFT